MSAISWECRLTIATEIANALSYLHSAASTPIIHRDMKSANILLDEKYTAKVSDFGASKLIPLDQTGLNTVVQGTLGYLDPEYYNTSELSEKSDVYSFGVVVVELLTGRKPISFERVEEERNLVTFFISSMEEDNLPNFLSLGFFKRESQRKYL
ncbi:hypothetical protein MKX01_032572 [Papaver californicum]|nr:hypothetical protein MKX01_032572 [Papaver californicum]